MFHILLGALLILAGLFWIVIQVLGSMMLAGREGGGIDPAAWIGLVPIGLGVLAIWWW